ncbi:DUF5134 domain-containing protein [Streptomyces sp. NPDC005890]|uniref:DUF5134 domain-containing protein n=1 Tax=Streptomyces sp. NPDC005890 TaxID=3154568 RepID=UPI0033D61427
MHHAALSGFPGWLLAALCAAVGGYCLLRARTGSGAERAGMTGDAVMGWGMAVMAVPSLMPVLPGWSGALFGAVFAAAGLGALVAAGAWHQRVHHAVGALAMVHMALAMPAGGHGAATAHGAQAGGTGVPLLTGALLAYFAGYVLYAGATLVTPPPAGFPAPVPHTGLFVTRACRTAMGLAMLTMLAAI